MSNKPTLAQMISNAIESKLLDVHTSLPAEIIKYDNGKAEVKILIKRNINGEPLEFPPIPDVPVLQPRSNGGKSYVSMPIKKGDTGMVTFQERSIDKWLVSGGSVDPDDARKFDLSDAIFTPGLYPDNNKLEYENKNALEVVNDRCSIILHPDGKMEFKGVSEDFVSIVSSVIDNLIGATTISTGTATPAGVVATTGSFDPATIAKFTQNKVQIATIKK